MKQIHKLNIEEITMEEIQQLFGHTQNLLKVLSDTFDVELVLRDANLLIMSEGEHTQKQIEQVILYMIDANKRGVELRDRDVEYASGLAKQGKLSSISKLHHEVVNKTVSGKSVYPKTLGQSYLFKCMRENDITFACGVAGTGKTYLAVMYALSLLKQNKVEKIILTRPAVEAGESLGFLPGDLKEKVDPYLTPLYDALHDALGVEAVNRLLEKGIIEIAPLAYMRGRTLHNAFIILDEAQNSTKSQMKMFLTRMGFHSKIVVTGDVTQIDLIKKTDSGLLSAKQILSDIKDIAFVELTSADVVRNRLVQKIIDCYETYENQ